jgi:putative cardiolipin synthase
LHTKALAIDERQLFVGSYNLDPRSTSLNCEQGVLVANAELALQLEALFAEQTAPAHAWSVRLSDGELSWSDGEKTFDADPMASAMRRFQAWGASVLPVESQL